MIPGPFSYHRPATVADAVKLLSTLGDDARPLVRFAAEVGFRVVVVDRRPALLTRERFPAAALLIESTGAEEISSTGEAKADWDKTDKPMQRAS